MSYLVLARKYRPQTFDEVVGQNHVTTTLKNAIEQGRVHHAFLFSGVRGTGKTTTARILAKALNCEKGPTPTPCNECRSCREISAGTSPDVQEIDGASHTGVDDIRELREAVRYLPTYGRQKVYIIDEVHMLSVSAFNALLKTLEEPPAHVTFIFATTEPQKIPATILSRCQRFDFRRVTVDEIQGHLVHILEQEGLSAEHPAVRTIAVQAGGSVRDSLSLLDQIIAYSAGERITEDLVARVLGLADRTVLADLAQALLGRDPAAVLEIIDDVFRSGWDLVQLMRALVSYLRDLVVTSVAKDPARLLALGPTELGTMKDLTARHSPDRLLEVFDAAVRATEDVSRSEFQKMTCEMRLVELAITEPIVPFPDLLSRIEAMETRLTPGGPVARSNSPSTQAARRATGADRNSKTEPRRSSTRPAGPGTAQRPAGNSRARQASRQSRDDSTSSEPQHGNPTDDDPDPSPRENSRLQGSSAPGPENRSEDDGPARAAVGRARVGSSSPANDGTGPEPRIQGKEQRSGGSAIDPKTFDPGVLPFPPPSEEQMNRWAEIVSVVKTRAPFLAATLALARIVSLEESGGSVEVKLAVPPKSLGENRLDDDAARKCAGLVRDGLGLEVSLHLSPLDPEADRLIDNLWRKVVELNRDPAGPSPEDAQLASLRPLSLADKQRLDRAKKSARIEREAIEDPAVRKAQQLLGARVRGVKVLD